MTRAIKVTAVVQEGGVVRIASPDLDPGASVEVIVLQNNGRARPTIREILAGYQGGRLFKTAEEADAAIREERDAWGV